MQTWNKIEYDSALNLKLLKNSVYSSVGTNYRAMRNEEKAYSDYD